MLKKLVITACIEALVFAVAAMISPQFFQEHGLWVALGAVFILMLVAAYDAIKNSGRANGGGPTTTQTTGGPNSPALSGTFGDVYLGPPPPAARQEPKSPHGSARESRPRRQRPEMPMWQALGYIARAIGDRDRAGGFPKARQELRQAALNEEIEVWGQRDIPSAHMKDNRHKSVWTPIDAEYWHDYELNILAGRKQDEEKWHTENEDLPGLRGDRYWNLVVRAYEIGRRWQKPSERTNDGSDWKTV